jgi:hypothetical protein
MTMQVLASKPYRAALRQFMQSQFSEESLDFIEAVERFQTIDVSSGSTSETGNRELLLNAKEIYSGFIAPSAEKQVNIDSGTVKACDARIKAITMGILCYCCSCSYLLSINYTMQMW